tara:strand:+ start:743 stop:1015 length:273 start_codon:yes stop_codon:yes gene_type:complete
VINNTEDLGAVRGFDKGDILFVKSDRFVGVTTDLAVAVMTALFGKEYKLLMYKENDGGTSYTEHGQEMFDLCLGKVEEILESHQIFNWVE